MSWKRWRSIWRENPLKKCPYNPLKTQHFDAKNVNFHIPAVSFWGPFVFNFFRPWIGFKKQAICSHFKILLQTPPNTQKFTDSHLKGLSPKNRVPVIVLQKKSHGLFPIIPSNSATCWQSKFAFLLKRDRIAAKRTLGIIVTKNPKNRKPL